jgi:hypothetical protein
MIFLWNVPLYYLTGYFLSGFIEQQPSWQLIGMDVLLVTVSIGLSLPRCEKKFGIGSRGFRYLF